MQLTLDISYPQISRKITQSSLQITARDLEILKFITEMKFSTVQNIYLRFFKMNFNGIECHTLRSAYRRLLILEDNKFLISTKNFLTAEKIYLSTAKSYFLLIKDNIDLRLPYPAKKLDHRTYEHDHHLILIRQHLEQTEKITDWQSDRYIKIRPEYSDLGSLNISPDAIYINPENQKIALELEMTLKSKERYRTKIKNVVLYLRSQNQPKSFQKIRFLCSKKSIFETLNHETKIYHNYFQIQMLEEVLCYKGNN